MAAAPGRTTMRAVVVPRHGGPEVLAIDERPIPSPGPGEVLVAVRAAGLNHLDTFVRRGMPGIKLPLPMIPGSEPGSKRAQRRISSSARKRFIPLHMKGRFFGSAPSAHGLLQWPMTVGGSTVSR